MGLGLVRPVVSPVGLECLASPVGLAQTLGLECLAQTVGASLGLGQSLGLARWLARRLVGLRLARWLARRLA